MEIENKLSMIKGTLIKIKERIESDSKKLDAILALLTIK
jgi:hypothetical protein